MIRRKISHLLKHYGWLVLISLSLLISLIVMSEVLQNAIQFSKLYTSLLVASLSGILALLLMLFRTLRTLRKDFINKRPGARITSRLTLLVSATIGIPLIITYLFSINFINQGIDQWFGVKTESALTSAVKLVQISLDDQRRNRLKTTQQAGNTYQDSLATSPILAVNKIRKQFNIREVALYTLNGQLIAYSSKSDYAKIPKAPSSTLFQQVRNQRSYASIESVPSSEGNYQIIRVMIPLLNRVTQKYQVLYATYPIPDQLTFLAAQVQESAGQYQKLSYLKGPLKTSFTVILTVLLLLTLLTSILFIIKYLEGVIKPVEILAKGTRSVAQGDYSVSMPVVRNDDLGELTQSFNDMIQQISRARNEIKFSHQQTEVQKLYLQTVIQNLNSGVITLDMNLRLKTINDSANQILNADLYNELGKPIKEVLIKEQHQHLNLFFNEVFPLFTGEAHSWSKQVNFECIEGQKILLIHGSTLPSLDQKIGGFVIVMEDVTALVQAQLHAAWSDIAKRLAHEIKNPLTPIQLSAERLQYKLGKKLDIDGEQFLTRMTNTIIAQVSSMQMLVQAFSEYADTPELSIEPININLFIQDIADMYSDPSAQWQVKTKLDPLCNLLPADASRIRQLLHNLVKNALEACEDRPNTIIVIQTKALNNQIEIQVADNGPGIPEKARNWIFEPYATDKPKGTGLGLAIVKKIVDEHQGKIQVKSEHGTQFILTLPIHNKLTALKQVTKENT